jgi:hypothetical protein
MLRSVEGLHHGPIDNTIILVAPRRHSRSFPLLIQISIGVSQLGIFLLKVLQLVLHQVLPPLS